MNRFKQTSSQEDIDSLKPNARIISRAYAPRAPSYPNKTKTLALMSIGSTCLGVLLSLISEQLDRGFRASEQIERATGAPVLALIPKVGRSPWQKEEPYSRIDKHPASAFGESIRNLYTGIHFSRLDKPPKKVLVTSSQPAEGKTTITMCLAKMQARAGRHVVVVDADFRRPGIHKALGLPVQPGLVDLLAEKAALADVCKKDGLSGVTIIPSGGSAPNPPDILASVQLTTLLETLTQDFDLVLLDSPPVMAISDARILSQKVDTTVFVVCWGTTRRKVVALALNQLWMSGGQLAGIALSMVDPRKQSRYTFGDSGYYSKAIKKYYST